MEYLVYGRHHYDSNNDPIYYAEIAGKSGDSKPTAGLCTGSIFTEVDTGKVFFFNEATSSWVEQFSFQS